MTTLPDLPAGFAVRPATMDDADAVADLLNAVSMATVGRLACDADEQRALWRSPYLDPETNCLVAIEGERLVGYAGAWIEPPAVTVYAAGGVHPAATGRGLGTYLAAWTEDLARSKAMTVRRGWILEARCWILGAGSRMVEAGSRRLGADG